MSEQELLNDISFTLKTTMKERGITQTDLARLTGIDRSLIVRYIHGQRMPSLKNLLNMFFVLDLRVDDEINMFDLIR